MPQIVTACKKAETAVYQSATDFVRENAVCMTSARGDAHGRFVGDHSGSRPAHARSDSPELQEAIDARDARHDARTPVRVPGTAVSASDGRNRARVHRPGTNEVRRGAGSGG